MTGVATRVCESRILGSPIALTRLGLAGGLAIAASSYWVGAIPMYFRAGQVPVVDLLPVGAVQARLLFYVGLTALATAWLALGRLTMAGAPGTEWRALRRTALSWAVPFVVAMPLASRDLWAYAAQSQLVLHHLDPYRLGPSALPSPFSIEVSHRWVGTPTPYGPLWLLIGKAIAAVVGPHVLSTVAAIRLLAVLGLVLVTIALPVLTERAGGRADIAIWLVAANPLTLVLGIGGGHNDLLMVGLMTAGLAIVTAGGWRQLIIGVAVLSAAVAVKSPAVIAVAFAVPLWTSGRRELTARAVTVVGLTAAATFSAITLASGLGFGWIGQANSGSSVVTWMSLPSSAAIVEDLLVGHVHGALKLDATMIEFRTVGTVVSIGVLVTLWIIANRGVDRRHWLTGSVGVATAHRRDDLGGRPGPDRSAVVLHLGAGGRCGDQARSTGQSRWSPACRSAWS